MKKYIILLTSFALSIYFYSKKATDLLLIMCLFIMFISMINFDNLLEHAGNVSAATTTVPPNEAIQNLAAMYNTQEIKSTKLNATDSVTTTHINFNENPGQFKENWLNAGGLLVLNGGKGTNLKNGLTVVGDLTVTGNIKSSGDILMEGGKSIKSTGRLHIATENDHIYLLPKGETIVGNEWGGSGNLTVKGAGGNIVRRNQSYRIAGRRGRLDNWANRCADGDKDRDIGMVCEGGHGEPDNGLWRIV
jgi:hypothetical protein